MRFFKWVAPPQSSPYDNNPGDFGIDPFPRNEVPALSDTTVPSAAAPPPSTNAGVLPIDGNPSSLARPLPIIPSLTGPLTPTPELAPKLYKKTMEELWAKQYTKNMKSQEKARNDADHKRAEAQRTYNQIRICYFREVTTRNRSTSVSRESTTFPHVNLSQFPKILAKMNVTADDEAYFYDFSTGVWSRDDIDMTFTVISDQTIIVRHLDIPSSSEGIDAMIKLHAPERKSGKVAGRLLALLSRMLAPRRASSPIPTASSSFSTFVLPSTIPSSPSSLSSSTSPPSPRSSPSFPSVLTLVAESIVDLSASPPRQSRAPSGVIYLSGSPIRSRSPDILIKSEAISQALATADELWKLGRVYVPEGLGAWPAGIYARDMAFAFTQIFSGNQSDSEVKDRFYQVFPGVPYRKTTLYRQRTFWCNSEQSECDAATKMARDVNGLWTKWHTGSSGKAEFDAKKKSKSA
ncbi:hypothetical protein B0H14DRAFT_3487830 [Mycena olivaceomarginata]|nr:hypothetical protein B0H14DRAFT_3487830 [Mycena olivaceomarginata]